MASTTATSTDPAERLGPLRAPRRNGAPAVAPPGPFLRRAEIRRVACADRSSYRVHFTRHSLGFGRLSDKLIAYGTRWQFHLIRGSTTIGLAWSGVGSRAALENAPPGQPRSSHSYWIISLPQRDLRQYRPAGGKITYPGSVAIRRQRAITLGISLDHVHLRISETACNHVGPDVVHHRDREIIEVTLEAKRIPRCKDAIALLDSGKAFNCGLPVTI